MATLSLVKNPDKQSLDNSGTKHVATMVKLDSITTADPFKTLFAINPSILEKITEDIMENGFDPSQPLHIWKEKGILVDGHTRFEAARRADLFQIPVFEHSFDNEASALEYAIHTQRDRRNLSDAELYSCILELDKRGSRGGARFKGSGGPLNDPKHKTADIVGTSANKVQKVRTISDHAAEEIKDKLKRGTISINQAYTKTQEARKGKASTPRKIKDDATHSSTYSISNEIAAKNRIILTFKKTLSAKASSELVVAISHAIEVSLGTDEAR